jgi:hypothetical protein
VLKGEAKDHVISTTIQRSRGGIFDPLQIDALRDNCKQAHLLTIGQRLIESSGRRLVSVGFRNTDGISNDITISLREGTLR